MRRAATAFAYLGTLAVVLSLGKLHADRIGRYEFTGTFRFAWLIAYVGLLCVAAYAAGIPDLPRTIRGSVGSAVVATGASAGTVSLVQLFAGSLLLPRYVVFLSAAVLVPFYAVACYVADSSRDRQEARDRVLAVAGANEASHLGRELTEFPERPAMLAAVLDPEVAETDATSLERAAEDSRATVVVLDRQAQAREAVVAQAALLHARGIRIRSLSLFYEEWLGKVPISELEQVALLFDIRGVHRAQYGRLKRLVDLVAAAVALVTAAPLVPAVLLGNLVANRGPMFFRQRRVGKAGTTFEIFKLRTMRPGGETHEWTLVDDPRLTPFGRFLRRTHIDELPQLLNLLRGDVTLVGPRPEQPAYVEKLRAKIPFYDVRHIVRPGLTGWAQVKFGYAGSESDALEKLQYEIFYLRHQDLVMDAKILGRTIRQIVRMAGR